MNLNYLLSGTVSINPVLGMFGLFLVLSWRICGWIGLESLVTIRFGPALETGRAVPGANASCRAAAISAHGVSQAV